MVKKKLSGKKLIMYEALIKTLGSITASVEVAGISRRTHYDWLENDPNYKELIDELPERQVDFYENALNKLVKDGTPSAIIFALKCKGKSRGWIEKQEIDFSGSFDYKTKEFEEEVNKYLDEKSE